KPEFNLEFVGTKGTLGISRSGFAVTPEADMPPENQVPGLKDGHPACGARRVAVASPRPPRTAAMTDRSGDSAAQYRAQARDFLDCVRSRKTPGSDVASGHRVAAACHLANLSLRLGRSLRWDPKAETIPADAEA